MFERRLKIFLSLLAAVVAALLVRAVQLQLLHRDYWTQQATDAMKRTHLVNTARGAIRDYKGRELAVDQPCIDACVDYRVIQDPPDEKWVKAKAIERLRGELGDAYAHAGKKQREQMRLAEIERVKQDILGMWVKLAQLSGRSPDEIDAAREAIVRRVEMRRRYVWYHNYEKAAAKQAASREEQSAWRKWLLEGGPDEDKFQLTVAEQLEPHVILPAVETKTQNELGKDLDRYPGLLLRPGTHRFYPYHDVACHLLGTLSRVDREDLKLDEKADRDELRQYLPNDLIGRTGIESLCEPTLRGTRGRYDKVVGDEHVLNDLEPVPGRDVRLTIDIELQQQIQAGFADARIRDKDDGHVIETSELHGAAVVIDVKTGEVRALVSYPTFDLNTLDEQYARLRDDDLNEPLLNRATMAEREPGSSVKPMVGLAGVTEGVVKVDEGIECRGFLYIDGRRYGMGRCWVASQFGDKLGANVAHHPVPWSAPHPTGFLTFSDALERSCNIWNETVADRLGIERLSAWFGRFGYGRPTGIGIAEAKGRLPVSYPLPGWRRRSAGWFAGIGQGYVLATPIQVGNVAATIARGGIWMRPTLLARDDSNALPSTRPGSLPDTPDRVDLHLAPEALAAAREGMIRVVSSKAGTGTGLIAGDEMLARANIAGKTGTAQASRRRVIVRDENGQPKKDAQGNVIKEFLVPSTKEAPNLKALWYRGSGSDGQRLDHAWYIGFAPADNPQVAFAVMVEYGGSGGLVAGSVAREALEACIARHYLRVKEPPTARAADH